MKTSLFSAIRITFLYYSVLQATTSSSFYFFRQFYNNHLRISAALNREDENSDSVDFIPAVLIEKNYKDYSGNNLKENVNSTSPLPDLDPISKNIYLHTNAGTTFVSKNKTRIEVPPFAFLDENGNAIDAEVEMQYREFFRPFEIFLSGTSMNFDSSNTLSTSCLLEIVASSFGKKVFINPEKPIIISSPAFRESNNLYYQNPESLTWYAESNPDTSNIRIPTDHFIAGNSTIKNGNALAFKCKTKMTPKREHFLGRKSVPDHFIFTFMNFRNQIPEFNELINTNWICDDYDALRNYYMIFSPGQEDLYAEEIVYCDSALLLKKGNIYSLQIISNNKHIELKIKPFIANAADELKINLALESYTLVRENRLALESGHTAFLNGTGITSTDFAETKSIDQKVKFKINKLGKWNIGNLVTKPLSDSLNVSFVDELGRKINISTGWMTVKNINALMQVTDMNRLTFRNPSHVFFWTILPDRKIGIVYPDEFKRKPVNGEIKYKMKVYEDTRVLRSWEL